ncbi:hypothetical protein [Mucilaginibacter gotjawali]|nr:hypothetical protein [Mucilaginibacter gotjawali]MBB3055455.1 ABC-type xylose transport system permease subunit [Mucilaginibacter gotjawali]
MEFVFYYKITCLLVGLAIIFLGYKLFVKGVFIQSGDLEATFKNNKLIIKKALPGTYFVVLGTIIICCTIIKGLSSDENIHGFPLRTTIPKYNLPSPKLDDSITLK